MIRKLNITKRKFNILKLNNLYSVFLTFYYSFVLYQRPIFSTKIFYINNGQICPIYIYKHGNNKFI